MHTPAGVAHTKPLLSIGILSVDHTAFASRRAEQRLTWVGVAHAQEPHVIARFAVRCGARLYSSEPYQPSEALLVENATNNDVVCTDVPEDAGKLKVRLRRRGCAEGCATLCAAAPCVPCSPTASIVSLGRRDRRFW